MKIELLGDEVGKIVTQAVKESFALQGHKLTGELERSIEYKVNQKRDAINIDFYLYDYGMIQNYGVTASRIPFNPGSGAKTSKYIDGLKNFAKLRFGVDDKKAKSIAFAIAYKHKQQGMPTRGSYAYSKNGKRTGAIFDALKESDDKVMELINAAYSEYITQNILSVITEVQKKDSENIKFFIR